MSNKTEKVKLALLVRNTTIYPRIEISEANVLSIKRSLLAGYAIPPVIADRKTKWVIDGFHRCLATERAYGPTSDISVEWRDYPNKIAMLEDAILLQNHGERLQPIDQARCAILAAELGMQDER